jgi:acetyl/propionyl-CoA carboxylase alpha subunit
MFDEVDDETYKQFYKQEALRDDFIEDDDGNAFIDDEEEDDWDESPEPEYVKRSEKGQRKQDRKKVAAPVKTEHQIGAFFQRAHTQNKTVKKVITTAEEETFMINLLNDLDMTVGTSVPSTTRRNDCFVW